MLNTSKNHDQLFLISNVPTSKIMVSPLGSEIITKYIKHIYDLIFANQKCIFCTEIHTDLVLS